MGTSMGYDGYLKMANRLSREAVTESSKDKWDLAMFYLMLSNEFRKMMNTQGKYNA